MPTDGSDVLRTLERWSPAGFVVSGLGFLLGLALLLVDAVTAVTVSEIMISVFTVPGALALSLVALPGYYRYVADASPTLALGGVVAAAISGASVALVVVGGVALDLLGISGFTEEGPLMFGFFLWLLAFFLSMLFYGVASTRTGEPSRVVGLLLLVVIVEPGAALLNDVTAVDLGVFVLYATLAVAGGAFLAVGYLLRSESTSPGQTDLASDAAA